MADCSCGYAIGHPLVKACSCKKKEWVELTDDEVVERANQEAYPEAFARGVLWAGLRLKKENFS